MQLRRFRYRGKILRLSWVLQSVEARCCDVTKHLSVVWCCQQKLKHRKRKSRLIWS